MMNIIAQIVLCMVAASILGFIIGWIFSSLIRNEKHQSQVLAVKERFDEQKAQISQLETKIDTKDREILTIKEQYNVMQKEMTSNHTDNEDNNILRSKITDFEVENLVLLEQIKEQKICEDEKDIFQVEIKDLENEKQDLIERIEELKEFETSYKDNIHRIAELESNQSRDKKSLFEKKGSHKKSHKKDRKKLMESNEINDAICKDKQILTDKNLSSLGIKEDKISQIIKNLFANKNKS